VERGALNFVVVGAGPTGVETAGALADLIHDTMTVEYRDLAVTARHELRGHIAHTAWLGVHASLMTGVRNRVDAFVAWGADAFSSGGGPQVLDRSEAARISWEEDPVPAGGSS
jgi:NADH dehydrogenase FAD-containing subunit